MGREHVTIRTATCITQTAFRTWSRPERKGQDPGTAKAWAGLLGSTGARMRAVVSQPGRQRPMEVDKLEIDAWSLG